MKLGMFSLLVSGCSILLGGNGNSQTDIPGVTRPPVPDGAAAWSSVQWQAVDAEQPIRASEEQFDHAAAVAAGPGGWVAVGSAWAVSLVMPTGQAPSGHLSVIIEFEEAPAVAGTPYQAAFTFITAAARQLVRESASLLIVEGPRLVAIGFVSSVE